MADTSVAATSDVTAVADYVAAQVQDATFADIPTVAAQAAIEISGAAVLAGADVGVFVSGLQAHRAAVVGWSWDVLRDYAANEYAAQADVAAALIAIADANDTRG